jgi:aldose 1-epimerase
VTTSPPPSGEQIEIAFDDQRAVVVEVGGGLRTYSVGGRDVLDGYGVDDQCTSGRGQVLVPWPNRLEDGSYSFDGRTHQLPLTEPANRNAIHGLVRWVPWTVAEHGPQRTVLDYVIHPQPGYPFTVALEIEYELTADGLAARTTATNLGATACPYGAGAHPYVTFGNGSVDALELRVPGSRVIHSGQRSLPNGDEPVEGTAYDFRAGKQIGVTKLDNAFTDLQRDDDGKARVSVSDGNGRTVTLWVDESYPYLMVFTGDTLPDVARRSLAVEPMTCPPNAFRTGESVVRLEPGQSLTTTWGISAQ